MIVEAATPDLTQYTAQYELLCSQVIGSARNSPRREDAADQPRGVGLALLPSDIDAPLAPLDVSIRLAMPSDLHLSRPIKFTRQFRVMPLMTCL